MQHWSTTSRPHSRRLSRSPAGSHEGAGDPLARGHPRLSVDHRAAARGQLPLSAELLRIRARGAGHAWTVRRLVAGDAPAGALSSLERLRLRSGTPTQIPEPFTPYRALGRWLRAARRRTLTDRLYAIRSKKSHHRHRPVD